MSSFWLYPLVIAAGMLQALGVSMNSQLKISLGNPWLASAVSFAPILMFFLCALAVMPRPWPTPDAIAAMPWWAPLGGLAGAVAVFVGLTMVDKIGSGAFNGMVITANILTCLAIDHFGLLNMPVHQTGPGRIAGAVLMVAGVALISRF